MKKKFPSFSFSQMFLSSWRPYAWIAALAFLIFFKTFFYEITHFDDEVWLVRYRWFLKDWTNFLTLFFRPDLVTDFLYRPVLALTFLADTKIYGDSLWGYRLTNLIFHVVNSGLIFALLTQLKYDRALSLSLSLIFTIHPVMTMAVAWIPGRTETVFGFFIFSSFFYFLQFVDQGLRRHYFMHLMLFLLALFSKETAITLPLVTGLYLYFFCEKKELSIRRIWIFLSWGLSIFIWFGIRAMILKGQTEIPLRAVVESILVNSSSVFIQLGKVFLPFNLCPTPIIEDTSLAFGLVAFAMISFFIWITPRKRTYRLLFGIFWFLIFLLPSLAISLTFYEYRMHVPLLGLLIILMEVMPIQKLIGSPRRIFAFTALSVAFFGGITFHYCDVFKNAWNFSHAAVACSPRLPVAHANLARMYEMMGMKIEAKDHYAKALSIRPDLPKVHHNLGGMYLQQQDFVSAEKFFLREIFLNPRNDDVYVSFAMLRYQQDRPNEARAFLNKALELNSDNIQAHLFLAFDYHFQGDLEKTLLHVQELEKRDFEIPREIWPFKEFSF